MPAITASPRPHTPPTTNFTKLDNQLLEDFIKEAHTSLAIRLFLSRNTTGWQATWYVTTVSDLAKALGRSRSQVKEKLARLVAQGQVVREDLAAGGCRLALAELGGEDSEDPAGAEDGGKLASETVDNFSAEAEHSSGGWPEIRPGGGRKSGQGVAGNPATPPKSNHENHSGSASPKQRQTNKTNKKNRLLKPGSTPATTVENSLSKGVNRTVLVAHSSSGSRSARSPVERGSKIPGEPSLDDLLSNPTCEPVRFKRLRGFPDREEVPHCQRMDYGAFEALWDQCLTTSRDHTALQAYVWHSFTAAEAEYLILECRRASQNLYGYANRIVRAMVEGLSGPRRGSGG